MSESQPGTRSTHVYTDQERQELAQKLDKDLDDFIASKLRQTSVKESPPEQSIDEIAEELKNHPAFLTEIDPTKPLNPFVEGLQELKYNSEDSNFNAESYKDDGNNCFKRKKYKWAIDAYTEGIKLKPTDKLLNAVLYTNRAAAQFHQKNYRSSLTDAATALKFKPDHMKALSRCALCCLELGHYVKCTSWCDQALSLAPEDAALRDLRMRAHRAQQTRERDARKRSWMAKKEQVAVRALFSAIEKRGVKLLDGAGQPVTLASQTDYSALCTPHPDGARVYLDDSDVMHWPVVLLYPEYGESDVISSAPETSTVLEQLVHVFGPGREPAPWDTERRYRAGRLCVFWEDRRRGCLHRVDLGRSLAAVLREPWCAVEQGALSLTVCVQQSAFCGELTKQYPVS